MTTIGSWTASCNGLESLLGLEELRRRQLWRPSTFDGVVLCGARPKGEGADAMHAETIPPKGRTRHRKFEPKVSRSPSDVSNRA